MYEFIKRMYTNGNLTDADLELLVTGGRITAEEMQIIKDSKPQ
jgi:hypothetical protein